MKAIPELFSPPVPGQKPVSPQAAVVRQAPAGPSFHDAMGDAQRVALVPAPGRKPSGSTSSSGAPSPSTSPSPSSSGAAVSTAGAPRGGVTSVALQVMQATQQAAGPDGGHFKALLAQASVESRLNPQAKNSRSSAAGAFQFLERTWLDMVRRHGSSFGLGDLSRQISLRNGVPQVTDPATRKKILDLRHDINLSAGMASRYLGECRTQLSRHLGRPVSDAETRIAYVLGVGGAKKLIRTAENHPNHTAADLMPQAAKVNRPLFYERSGEPFTAAEALANMKRRMENDHRSMFASIGQRAEAEGLSQTDVAFDDAGTDVDEDDDGNDSGLPTATSTMT